MNLDSRFSQAAKTEEVDLHRICVSKKPHRICLSFSCSHPVSSETLLAANGFLNPFKLSDRNVFKIQLNPFLQSTQVIDVMKSFLLTSVSLLGRRHLSKVGKLSLCSPN
jgi:hypothetical protein